MKKIKIKPKWLRLSEETNALDYLEQAYYYIRQVDTNIVAWKWVILALHSALYGFAICACMGTSPDNVTNKTKSKLIAFKEALKRCQDPNRMPTMGKSKHLQLTDQQKDSIRRLKYQFRNYFEHFIPTGWSIEIHRMPLIALDVLEVIRFLALGTTAQFKLNQSQQKKIKSIVFQSKRVLKQSQLYKEAKLAEQRAGDR
jgi:hypothetical protein